MNVSTRVFQAFAKFWVELRSGGSNLVDTITGLTEKEKKIIQESKGVILSNYLETGIDIMLKFFKKHPQYLEFYSFKDIPLEELKNNEAFLKECKKLMDTVEMWIRTLGDSSELRDMLERTGKICIVKNFPEQSFWDFGDTVIEYLAPLMDKKTLEAWTKFIKFVMKTLVSSFKQ